MRRLYLQVYITIIVALLAVVLVAGAMWRRGAQAVPTRQAFEVAGELAALALAPAAAPPGEQQEAVERLAQRLRLDLALFTPDRRPIASAGRALPSPPRYREEGGWIYGAGGPTWAIELPDDRWLVARAPRRHHRHPAIGLVLFLGTIALLVAASAYPLVRGLTRRLERLQAGVEKLGGGDLTARVQVSGRDEVALLAASFNRAAERIEQLVNAHKMLLANASHELRTPLSRIRLGLELLEQKPDPERKAALAKDIAELDALIDEILTASRLDAVERLEVTEEVDLLALAAEEGVRYGDCAVSGEPVVVIGEPRLLRRMLRNLLENAGRHGAPPVEVTVTVRDGSAVLSVADGGPGIPETERERVFEPFRRGTMGASTGTGLGLALVRQIARRHGGDAVAAADPQRPDRSRFIVTLPAAGGTS